MKDITEGKKMQDKKEIFGKSVIHHGKKNNRIYVLKLHSDDFPDILSELEKLAEKEDYTKIFAKIPSNFLPWFISNDYIIEAFIPGFFKKETDCVFVSKFRDNKREQQNSAELGDFHQLLNSAVKSGKFKYKYSFKYMLERLGPNDAQPISELFKKVFETYPFPIHQPEYILKTMEGDNTQYFGIKNGNQLIGVSTAEIDIINKNAEMTDFAVLPKFRGQNLAFRLLIKMEQEMKYTGIKTAYTIARLNEPGMSKTFLKSGYKYSGTLINNTNIGGSIESMNIFYKHL